MTDKHTVLLVDDEENILNSIYRLLRREKNYDVLMANSGVAGLEILNKRASGSEPAISLILSDQRMPQMEGVEFLSKARDISPDTTRIMLTGYADINTVTAAINRGEIFRYITKPWEEETLLASIRQGIEQYGLITERKELLKLTRRQNEELVGLNQHLEQKVEERTKEIQELYKKLKTNFHDTIKVFVNLVELYDNQLGSRVKRVSALAKAFAGKLGYDEKEVEEIEIAALLYDIGLIGIPKITLGKRMEDLSTHEMALVKQHPVFAQSILYNIENLHQVGVLIRSHHERFDGKGFPDGIKGEGIPYGSRILALCDAYDEMLNKHGADTKRNEAAAVKYIEENKGKLFEPQMAASFLEFISGDVRRAIGIEEAKVTEIVRLEEGMVVARDIFSGSGRLLIPNGTVLSKVIIERLKNFHNLDPIAAKIYVKQ